MPIQSGDRFSRLVTQSLIGTAGNHRTWRCICDCGRECVAREDKLLAGRTKSCGCLRAEIDLTNEIQQQTDLIRAVLRDTKKNLMLAKLLMNKGLRKREAALGLPADVDYRKFEFTGSPREAADLLYDWADLVHDVLSWGPGDDRVTIRVDISIVK